MQTRRWVNQSQPQTLVIATFLLYLDAVFMVLLGTWTGLVSILGVGVPGIALIGASVGAGYGIANERKWAYILGVALAAIGLYPYIAGILVGADVVSGGAIGLMFAVARMALLLHPQSREYQRIWFK